LFLSHVQDFRQAVADDVLLLESLSSCLPPTEFKKAFLLMISGDLNHIIRPTNMEDPGSSKKHVTGLV
jgi:hypothetical protein